LDGRGSGDMLNGEKMEDIVVNTEEIGFGNSEIPVEDFDEFALYPSNVTLAERAGDHSPVNVLQGGVIGVFGSDDESAEKNAMKGPLLGLNGEIGPCALDVDEGDKNVGDADLSSFDDGRDELGELWVLVGAGDRTSARSRGGWETKSKVDDLRSRLDELLCEIKVSYGSALRMWRVRTD
jgi:hypothetical protein